MNSESTTRPWVPFQALRRSQTTVMKAPVENWMEWVLSRVGRTSMAGRVEYLISLLLVASSLIRYLKVDSSNLIVVTATGAMVAGYF